MARPKVNPSTGLFALVKQFGSAVFGLMIMGSAAALDDESAANLLDAFVLGSQSMEANFSQITSDDSGRLIVRNKGRFWLLRPDRFRWDYDNTEQQIISDGEQMYVYDKDLEQLTVRDLDAALSQSPSVALLMSGEKLRNLYNVSAVESDGGVIDWITLQPLVEDAGYEYLELGFSEEQLIALRMEDLLGQKTIIQFDQVEINVGLDKAIFEFDVPANVDVFYD